MKPLVVCTILHPNRDGWREREKEGERQGQRQKEIENVLLTLKKKILLVWQVYYRCLDALLKTPVTFWLDYLLGCSDMHSYRDEAF